MKKRICLMALGLAMAMVHAGDLANAKELKLDQTQVVEFSEKSPKRASHRYEEFTINVQQGDRLKFSIQPVKGADLPTGLRILKPDGKGNALEHVKKSAKIEYRMKKGYPGSEMTVQIQGFNFGKVEVLVTK